jgi:hypothetical protein
MSPRERLSIVVAVVFVGAVFATMLSNPFVSWDDGVYIVHNPLVTHPAEQPWSERLATRALSYPLPLPVLLYGLVHRVSAEPFAFHGLSLLVHLLNVALLAHLLDRDLRSAWLPAGAAVLWGVHPLVVEPVAWATGLKDLLVGTGVLLAFVGYRRGGAWVLVGGLVALASKPNAAAIGLAFVALAWHGRRDGASGHGSRVTVLAVATLAIAGLALVWFSLTHEPPELRASLDIPVSPGRVAAAYGIQVMHAFAPLGLSHVIPYEAMGPGPIAVGTLALALTVVALVRWWRSPADPRLAWLLIAGAVWAPVSNLHPLHRFTADSFAYVPLACAVAIGALSWERLGYAERDWGRAPALGLIALIAAAASLTLMRIGAWSSTSALWTAADQAYPHQPQFVYRLGEAHGIEGSWEQERSVYERELDTLARYEKVPTRLPAYLEADGDVDAAAQWFERAFARKSAQDPELYIAYVEFVGRYPDRFDPGRTGAAFRYALRLWAKQDRARTSKHRAAIAAAAERVGAHEIAASLRQSATG